MLKRITNTVLLCSSLVLGVSFSAYAQKKVDITEKGGFITTSFAPQDNAAERAGMLLDNKASTKMYAGNGSGGSITFICNALQVANGYSITSANDARDRDLMRWKFEGSVDGKAWVVLDDKSTAQESFPDRFQKKAYSFVNTTAYKYYRISNIERYGNNGAGGSGSIQVAEIEILADNAAGMDNINVFGGKTRDQYNTGSGSTGPEKATDSYVWLPSADNATAAPGGGSRYLVAHNTTWLIFSGYYKSIAKSYSITSSQVAAADAFDPKDWSLYATNDTLGTWTKLDSQTGQKFTFRGETKTFSLTNTTYYKFYKLDITANNGDPAQVSLAEWQLDGQINIPVAPTTLAHGSVTNNTANITWKDNSSNEDNFIIEVSKDKINWFRKISAPANSNSYVVKDLSSNISYFFRVSAQSNDFGVSDYTNTDSIKTVKGGTTYASITDYPGVLFDMEDDTDSEGRQALIDDNVNTKMSTGCPTWIQWWAMYPAAVDKYVIASANDNWFGDPTDWTLQATNDTTNGGTWVTLDTRTNEMFTDRFESHTYTFTNTTKYSFYRLNLTKATVGDNASEGDVQFSQWELYGTSDGYGGMSSPTNLKATAVSGTVDQIDISWADNTKIEENYVVESSLDKATGWKKLVTLDKNTTSYSAKGLDAETEYFFRVYAVNADGPSVNSNIASATTNKPQIVAPTDGFGDGFNKVSTIIAWTDNAIGEDNYEVERSTTTAFTTVTKTKLAANSTYFIDSTVAANTTYYYRLRAVSDLYSNSPYIDPVIKAAAYPDMSTMVNCDTLKGVAATALLAGNGGEEVANILDSKSATKYNTSVEADPPMWVEIDLGTNSAIVNSYSVTSAQDNTFDRDPYEWTFEASNDGISYDVLHDLSAKPQMFPLHQQERLFQITNTKKYTKYRFNCTALRKAGKGYFQIADLKLFANRKDVTVGVAKDNDVNIAPKVFTLSQNYPNPFNPTTKMTFTLEKSGHAVVKVYNILGAEVATLFNGQADAGKYYHVTFDASKLSSGVYIARVESGAQQIVRKLILMK